MRIRLEGVPHWYHEDTLLQKEWVHSGITIWYTNLCQCLKHLKKTDAKKIRKIWRKSWHGSWQKSETKERWSKKLGIREARFISRHWWSLPSQELREPQYQKFKGRVVRRGDIVKDDSGSLAVFTEQGSSASQMTAAKVMDIISRLPGCSGQAADAVSAKTQVRMEDAPKLLKIPNSECSDIWIRLPKH